MKHLDLTLARVTPRRQRPATARTAHPTIGQPLLELLLADQQTGNADTEPEPEPDVPPS
jgi:hypothetical protein